MIVSIDKSFEKDTDMIDDKSIRMSIARIIEDVQKADSILQIKNLKKLKSFSNEFRIKAGHFRLGVRIEKDSVRFIRCLHRKDIYRYFPK